MIIGFILGIIGGVVSGMGMGGGTLLIPLITTILSIEQKSAQGINLLSFIPMAIVSLIIHIRNRLVDFKVGLGVILSGLAATLVASLIANNMDGAVLRKIFGVFLLIIGVYQIVCVIRSFIFKNSTKDTKTDFKIHIWHI